MALEHTDRSETYAEDTALTELFGNGPKVKIIAALLGESDHDLNVTQIAELAGIHRTTVYDHLEDLLELGVVEQTRTVGGSQMYRIDRDSTVAEDVAQLEWDLLDVIGDEE
ncbi:hypothetical protein BRC81_06130 [Halobacteriales archaeon QS_1_68_20]|nr:MAG: hypothetical protein BRC81_06130 [Halobacteriales archaeon QS_1_68_20]